MSVYKSLAILQFTVLVACSVPQKETKTLSINDEEFRNGKYLWWENSDGNGVWIEINGEGDWNPSNGNLTEFYDNGKIKLSMTYVNGEATGICKGWNQNGELVISGSLTNNRPDSIYQIFHRNGQVRAKYYLENCHPYQIEIYSRSGAKVALFNLERLDNGNFLKGNQYIYYANGNLKVKYENNVRTIYSQENAIINQTKINDISLHYVEVTLQLLVYYIEKTNFSKPMRQDFGCISGDCQNGEGTYSDVLGAVYSGDFKNGFLNGTGTICLANGDTLYSGNFLHGMFEGKGTFYGYHEKYSGQFKLDLYNGYGEIEFSDGSNYKGQFVNNLLNGQGTYKDVDGTKYYGIWKDGEFVE